MKYSLFNEEVEGFTQEKLFGLKLVILCIAIFAGALFVGWIINTAPHIISAMDVVAG